MMPKWTRFSAVLALFLGSGVVFASPPAAKCVYCATYECFGPCGQCACMRRGPEGGQCVTFDRVQEYQSRGFTEQR